MNRFIFIALTLALSGCMAQTTSLRLPPVETDSCLPASVVPKPPGTPRTTESIAGWALELQSALLAADRARDDCAEKLARLNDWIRDSR